MKKTIVSFVIGIIFGLLLSEVVFTLVSSSDYIDNEKKYGIVELLLVAAFKCAGNVPCIISRYLWNRN